MRIILILLCLIPTSLMLQAEEIDVDSPNFTGNRTCPITPKEEILEEFTMVYNGVTIYFCCENCIGDFREEPDRYLPNLPKHMLQKINAPLINTAQNETANATDTPFPPTVDEIIWTYTAVAVVIPWLLILLWWYGRKLFINLRYPNTERVTFCLYDFVFISACILLTQFVIYDIRDHLEYRRLSASATDAAGLRFERDARYHFGSPPHPIRPRIPHSLNTTYYRGNDQRSPSLHNGGQHLTCTFLLSLRDLSGEQINFNQTLQSNKVFVRLELIRAPHTPDQLYREELMSGVKITDNDDLAYVRDLENGLRLSVLEKDQKWRVDIPITLKPGKNNGVYYMWETRIGYNKKKLYPKMHYAIEYEFHFDESTITESSDLWMGFIRTAEPLRSFDINHTDWLSTEPIPPLSKPNASSATTNDSDV